MNYLGFIYALAAAILWGLVYTIDQKILYQQTPLSLLFLASLIGLLITIPFIWWNWNNVKPLITNMSSLTFFLVLTATILGALANFSIFSSIKILDASVASIFEISYPFFVVLFSWLIFGGSFNLWFFGGALLIFVGSATIILKA
jgi:drug/metabolite transporter (DMT)-like permease